jgi:hypothetical protein
MNLDRTLITTTLLSALLFALHWSDEITRGLEHAALANLGGIAILVVWLCSAALVGRRSGYILTLLGGSFGFLVLIAHMQGAGIIGRRIAGTDGIFFWVLTLIALGTISAFSAILAGVGLWRTLRSREQR